MSLLCSSVTSSRRRNRLRSVSTLRGERKEWCCCQGHPPCLSLSISSTRFVLETTFSVCVFFEHWQRHVVASEVMTLRGSTTLNFERRNKVQFLANTASFQSSINVRPFPGRRADGCRLICFYFRWRLYRQVCWGNLLLTTLSTNSPQITAEVPCKSCLLTPSLAFLGVSCGKLCQVIVIK